jgi:DNA-binding transcriptional ArsR family regulator
MIAFAVLHPVRLDALSILIERIASPNEIAEMLHVPLGTVSHHVSELHADKAVELVNTEQRRGAVEHYYRATVRPEVTDAEWKAMPRKSRREFAATLLLAIVAEGLASLRHGMMDTDDDLHIIWKAVRTDAQARSEISELHAEMVERLEAIAAGANARIPDTGDDADVLVRIVAMMTFVRSRPGEPAGYALSLGQLEK